jgi:hypothetical protein
LKAKNTTPGEIKNPNDQVMVENSYFLVRKYQMVFPQVLWPGLWWVFSSTTTRFKGVKKAPGPGAL